MLKPFEAKKILPDRIPLWLIWSSCALFGMQQLWLGESLITMMVFTLSLVIFFLGFNLLGGLQTFPGIFFGLYGLSMNLVYALLCSIEAMKVSDQMDQDLDLLLINLISISCLCVAALIYKKTPDYQGLQPSVFATLKISNNLPNNSPTLIVLVACVAAYYGNLIPYSLAFLFQFSLPATCLVACNMLNSGRAKILPYLSITAVILIAWRWHGLTGMKSSLIMPMATALAAAAMVNLRLSWTLITLVLAVFICINVIAFAIQPLRNLPPNIGQEERVAYALAYLTVDLERRYSIELPIQQQEVKALSEMLRSRSSKNEQLEKLGIFSRISLVADDAKMLDAVKERGFLPIEKYFEEVIFVPRAVSGETFRLDKISAYYGRYAGSIGRFNTNTGVAFSSGTISYAHGGMLFLVLNLFCGALLMFWLTHLVFGSHVIQYDLSRLWMLSVLTSSSSSIELTAFWYLLTRGIPLAIVSYLMLYFVCTTSTKIFLTRWPSKLNAGIRPLA